MPLLKSLILQQNLIFWSPIIIIYYSIRSKIWRGFSILSTPVNYTLVDHKFSINYGTSDIILGDDCKSEAR